MCAFSSPRGACVFLDAALVVAIRRSIHELSAADLLQNAPAKALPHESLEGWLPFFQRTARAEDLEIQPLIARIHNTNINQWHPWRGAHRPFFPAMSLIEGGNQNHDTLSWTYRNKADQVVFRASDWKTGTLERINTNEYMLHGQYAFVDQKWLADRLASEKYRLAFVLSTFVKQRKDKYDEAKKLHQHKLLNFSAIIT